MKLLHFESLHEELVEFANTASMQVLNKNENLYLKKKATKLIFQSHNLLNKKCQGYNDLVNNIIFYQHLADFLNYLYLLGKKD